MLQRWRARDIDVYCLWRRVLVAGPVERSVVADVVHVLVFPAGGDQLLRDRTPFIVDDAIGAERLTQFDVGRRARSRDVAAADGFRDLDPEDPCPARAAVDED